MADEPATTPAKKKGKKLGTPQKIALGVGGVLVAYIGYRWYENRAASTAATTAATPADGTDPLTGQPYAAGVGSLAPGAGGAIDPETGQPYEAGVGSLAAVAATDPFQGVDPNSPTGETYAQEIGDLGTQDATNAGTTAATLAAIEATVTAIETGTSVNPTGSTGSTQVPDTLAIGKTRAALIAAVQKATGLSAAEAGQQVALYLEGKPLTNAGAVNSIGNQVKAAEAANAATIASTTAANAGGGDLEIPGALTLPAPVLAKGATQNTASTTSSTALKNAEAVAAKDKGTPAEAQANANVARTQSILAGQKK